LIVLNPRFFGKDIIEVIKMRGWKTILFVAVAVTALLGGRGFIVQGQERAHKVQRAYKVVENISEIEMADAVARVDKVDTEDEVEREDEVESTNPVENANEAVRRSFKDIPSPIQGEPLRKAGEYYSEKLDMTLFHAGTDHAQAEGAVIRIKHAGRVTYAGPDPLLGFKVEIDCGEGWSVVYGGLKNLRVKEGDWLEVNEAIGQIGYYPDMFGELEQTHLHMEIRHEDRVYVPLEE